MLGKELIYDETFSLFVKIYIFIFGAPISGLRIRARRILPLIKKMKFKTVLDIGCGMGIFSSEIARQFPLAKVTGIDDDRELIQRNNSVAEKAGLTNCKFIVKNATEINFNEEFDLFICIDALEHIEKDQKAITLIYNALKKDGKGIFHVPGYYRKWFFFGKKVNFNVKGHVRPGYMLRDIKEKIEKANFKILDIRYTYGFIESISNNISYLITGAEKKNKFLYAIIFPLLNFTAFFGQWAKPRWGAGIIAKVVKC